MSNTIVANELRKHYGDVKAVDGVTLEIGTGEFFGLLGPNGAGKTTTLEIFEGLREADGGEVTVFGMAPWPRNPKLLPRIGVQLQASSFFERLTAREQLRTFGSLYGVPGAKSDAMLEEVGLEDKADTPVEQLSGGQAQRLSIACALVHEPELVFLDEPTAALDPQARRNLWDLLRAINTDGRNIVLTTHYMDEAEILCDRVAVIDQGRILRCGAPAALIRGMNAPTRIGIPAEVISADEARTLPGAETVSADESSLTISTHDPSSVVGALAARNALNGVQVKGATLEDVFLELTGREFRP